MGMKTLLVLLEKWLNQAGLCNRISQELYFGTHYWRMEVLWKIKLLHFIIRLTHANVWESIGKPCSCIQFNKTCIVYYKSRKNPYQYYKSRENPSQVLQVMCNEIEGSYDKIIITIVPSYTGKILLICCRWHCYSCFTLVTIQTATNSWYFPV